MPTTPIATCSCGRAIARPVAHCPECQAAAGEFHLIECSHLDNAPANTRVSREENEPTPVHLADGTPMCQEPTTIPLVMERYELSWRGVPDMGRWHTTFESADEYRKTYEAKYGRLRDYCILRHDITVITERKS